MSVFLCTIREMENYNIKNGLIKMKKNNLKIRVYWEGPFRRSQKVAKQRARRLLSLSAVPKIEPFQTF